MKRRAKDWIRQLGLLDVAEPIYFDLKSASLPVVVREIGYMAGRSPDGFSLPPASLIYDVIACHWSAVYLDSGREIVADMEDILHRNGFYLGSFETVLDFGCGCGRLIRHVNTRTSANLHGCDYNPQLIEWSRVHLPFGEFVVNEIGPPLPYQDETFDYIYARSVLTHLPEHLQVQWMAELNRVLRPDGVLYFTMHGRHLAQNLSEEQKHAFEAGSAVVVYSDVAGENLCASYGSVSYVQSCLLDGFDLVDHVEGRESDHLRQDVYILRRRNESKAVSA